MLKYTHLKTTPDFLSVAGSEKCILDWMELEQIETILLLYYYFFYYVNRNMLIFLLT